MMICQKMCKWHLLMTCQMVVVVVRVLVVVVARRGRWRRQPRDLVMTLTAAAGVVAMCL
jgi:hypothetical protein